MASALPEELVQRLREGGRDDLRALLHDLLRERAADLDVPAAQAVLRNPHADAEIVRLLAEQRDLVVHYDLRRELALHPATPQPIALGLLSTLFWRDLVTASIDVRIPPVVRRAADQRLIERLRGLAVGEKVALARKGSPRLLQVLRHDPTPRVIAAMLENPRLQEADVLPLASAETSTAPVLEVLLQHRKWGSRYQVKTAVVRNPRAPLQLALHHLPLLKKPELRAVAADPRLSGTLRRKAELLLGL
jgi:hypothetical protein